MASRAFQAQARRMASSDAWISRIVPASVKESERGQAGSLQTAQLKPLSSLSVSAVVKPFAFVSGVSVSLFAPVSTAVSPGFATTFVSVIPPTKSSIPEFSPSSKATSLLSLLQSQPFALNDNFILPPYNSVTTPLYTINIKKIRRKKMNKHKYKKHRREVRNSTRYNKERRKKSGPLREKQE